MVETTKLIHEYLRHSKKFPHVYCPGCGHGIVLGSIIRSVHHLGLSKDEVVLIAGIGCSGRMAVYVDFNTIHTTHGRALTFATGVKLANPKLKVIVVMGDGDALSIGGNHFIHAARRNIGVTALVLNNNIYGMTGGQSSSTTPENSYSTTTPYGHLERDFDVVNLALGCGANFVSRTTALHAQLMDKLLTKAIENPGFNVVEVLTPCFTQYGRKNKFKNVVEMYSWYRKNTIKVEKYKELPEEKRAGKIPIGVFSDKQEPGFEEKYGQLREKLRSKK
ncbi:MAG TPA: 2-oxoacid:ferredoxin oxidoreductase subunit beta [Desulfonauticus sp.]|jgi:2-oxoglutarate ferredoxin oxidoreductase subunit beta|nr:MAG: Thiamine pyrophosphate protein domain protein TPP-binding [Desulfonauticus sp. 38_4375]HCO11944.1 2-oxoacid:ferredoxin oxidoreductase subunit beta [Desulfonauticus sp.]